jgi:acyl carrier protein
MTIQEKVASILSQISGVKEEEIKPETKLKSLGLDSLDTSELFMEIEEEFEILVEADWDSCETIDDIINVIRARI